MCRLPKVDGTYSIHTMSTISHPIQAHWQQLIQPYPDSVDQFDRAYQEIISRYTEKHRRYHNLQHIQSLLALSDAYYTQLQRPDVVLWAIFYHDIIYNVPGSNNEEKSAALAAQRLKECRIPDDVITAVTRFIICTKNHQPNFPQNDLYYFLDFDMAILGSPAATYQAYTQAIRQEYKFYPSPLYKAGRKKALKHFIEKEQLFFTGNFRQQFGQQALANITHELDSL